VNSAFGGLVERNYAWIQTINQRTQGQQAQRAIAGNV